MARIVLFVVLFLLAWMVFKMLAGRRRRDDDVGRAEPPAQRIAEPIAQCAWCGVHVPAATAQSLPDGRIYCSEAHREQARLTANPPS